MLLRALIGIVLLLGAWTGQAAAEGTQYNGSCTGMSWTPNQEPDLAGYRLYDRTSTALPKTLIKTLGVQITSATCLSLGLNTGQHYLSLASFDTSGNESATTIEIALVIVMDNQITDLRVTAIASTSVTLAFTEVTDGVGAPASYDVRYKTPTMDWGTATSVTAGTCTTPVAGVNIGATLTCTVTGLTATTPYEFQLIPYRGTINVDAVYGPLSNIVGATTGGIIDDLGDRTVLYSDTFTQADGVLTSPWQGGYTQAVAALNLTVVGNELRAAGTTNDSTMTYNVTLPTDQWCEFKIVTMAGSGSRAPRCLLAANAPGTLNAYEFTALVGVSGTKSRIMRWANGTASAPDILVSENVSSWVATDVLRAEKRGSILTLFKNGVQVLTTTDSTYTGGRGGIMIYPGSTASNVEIDNVRFGTFAVAGSDPCGCDQH